MNKLLMITAMSWLLTAQTMPAHADATSAQKELIARTREQVREVIKTDEGCRAICHEMMQSKKARQMMWRMMKADPNSRAMMERSLSRSEALWREGHNLTGADAQAAA